MIVLAPTIGASTLANVTGRIAQCHGNIERIVRLSDYPVQSYELAVTGGDLDLLRRALADEAVRSEVDIAVQRAGLHRRARHLIVLDADSTLLQGEVIDLLAERRGCGAQVADVTGRPWRGPSISTKPAAAGAASGRGLDESDLDGRPRRRCS